MKSFEISLKKGEMGEQIIRKKLESKGWIVYFPFTKNKPHYFDLLATYRKEKVIAVDIKAKARLNKYAAQGINTKHYEQYKRFMENNKIPFWLVFIDEYSGEIHTARIDCLTDPIYLCNGTIIAWSLKQMFYLGEITDLQKQQLQQYNQRNYKYQPFEKGDLKSKALLG